MFSYTGLTPEQVAIIQADSHVYMLQSGRINVAGCKSHDGKDLGLPYSVDHSTVTTKNVEYIARAIDAAVRKSLR